LGISLTVAMNMIGFEIRSDLVEFKEEKRTVYEKKYTPSVIEPSYGVGRILYALLGNNFCYSSDFSV